MAENVNIGYDLKKKKVSEHTVHHRLIMWTPKSVYHLSKRWHQDELKEEGKLLEVV